MKRTKTVSELAALVGGRVVHGDEDALIERVSSLESATAGSVVFIEDARLVEEARFSAASCVIAPSGASVEGVCTIEVARPKLAFAVVAEALHPQRLREPGVHPTAQVASSARIGEDVYVGPFCTISEEAQVGAGTQMRACVFIGEGAKVGRGCVLHPNVTLYDGAELGERVVLHAGVVVGADGFGYVRDDAGRYLKFPQIGTVVIEDDVEIGAASCIDRGALGETRIGRGAKIDNLVQIAHNVRIGERVVIAAQTGISGSTVIEADAVIGGQVGMGDHARVLSGAVIGSQAGVLPGKIVRKGVWWGTPVQPLDEYKRLNALRGRLPRMRKEIDELKRQVKELTEKIEKA